MDFSALAHGWFSPTRENYELVLLVLQFFPLVTIFQWIQPWYPAGKTSNNSAVNLPGKLAWAVMESPTIIVVPYLMLTLPSSPHTDASLSSYRDLPLMNWALAGMYVVHYTYRTLLCPLLNPSMSPIHLFVASFAFVFQTLNAISFGGWLAGYGPTTQDYWSGNAVRAELGMMLWAVGLMGNMFHDDELREIRRAAARNTSRRSTRTSDAQKKKGSKKAVDKVYVIPQNGLFRYILYPHYVCEWFEWAGFWMVGGAAFVPARIFLLNEIATMLPRAVQGKGWYEERFGKDRLAGRTAVIPGVI